MALTKQERRQRIKYRIRKKVLGTTERPRLCVFRSNRNIFAQLIDDVKQVTVVATSSRVKNIADQKVNKVEQAKLALEQTDQSVTDIAYNLGWSSGNYFCTVFKKLTGMSPLQYRKQNRAE